MTQGKSIILRTIVFNSLVIRKVPDCIFKNAIILPTKDALNTKKSHDLSQHLGQKGHVAHGSTYL